MIELLIAAVAAAAFFFYLTKVKKQKNQAQNDASPAEKIKPAAQADVKKEPLPEAKTKPTVVEAIVEKPVVQAPKTTNDNAPQDSTLKRHNLSQLAVMIKAIQGPRPDDSTLSRHYDALVNAQMDDYLNNPVAMAQLNSRYENLTKSVAQVKAAPTATVKIVAKAKPAAAPSPKVTQSDNIPTDSTLRRHHETMLKNK